jgi:hypothetical protein
MERLFSDANEEKMIGIVVRNERKTVFSRLHLVRKCGQQLNEQWSLT